MGAATITMCPLQQEISEGKLRRIPESDIGKWLRAKRGEISCRFAKATFTVVAIPSGQIVDVEARATWCSRHLFIAWALDLHGSLHITGVIGFRENTRLLVAEGKGGPSRVGARD